MATPATPSTRIRSGNAWSTNSSTKCLNSTNPPRELLSFSEPYSSSRQANEMFENLSAEKLCEEEFKNISMQLALAYSGEFKKFRTTEILNVNVKIRNAREIQAKFKRSAAKLTSNADRDFNRFLMSIEVRNEDSIMLYRERWRTLKERQDCYWSRQVLYCCESVLCDRDFEKLCNVVREIIRERFSSRQTRSREETIHLRQGFYELVNESLRFIEKDYSILDIPEQVNASYADSEVTKLLNFSDVEANCFCEKALRERREPKKFPHIEIETAQSGRTRKLRSELMTVSKMMAQKLLCVPKDYRLRIKCISSCLFTIENYVSDLMAGVEHFDKELVQATISKTEAAFQSEPSNKQEDQQLVHNCVRIMLIDCFEAIQLQWNSKNSVMAKFKEQYDIEVMWEYFVMVSSGVQNGKLFSFLLKKRLADGLVRAFEAETVALIVARVRKLDWLYDANWTARHMDLRLLSLIDQNEVEQLVHCIASPSKLLAEIVEITVRNLMPKKRDWQKFISNVKEAIELSVYETLFQNQGLASNFVNRLAHNFSINLESDVLSRLFKIDVANECKSLDDTKDGDEFLQVLKFELFTTIDEKPYPVDCQFVSQISDLVINRLRAENSSVAMPRCEHCCPVCRALCIWEAGHDHEQLKHDAIHQPAGLGGTCDVYSGALDWRTCIEYEDDARMFLGKGVDDNCDNCFRDWTKVFYYWEKPHHSRHWPLREYLLFNYHQELAKYYGCKPCEQLPKFYKRDLEKIRDDVKRDDGAQYP